MNDILDGIDKAKYVMIVTEASKLPCASALYTHVLRLHKKVSLICESKSIDNRFSFLPWFEKIKSNRVASADFLIELNHDCVELYNTFIANNIKINNKMATALYAGLLNDTQGFTNSITSGTIFAVAKELVESGADYKTCNSFIRKRTTLATLRLKSIMLEKMLLQNSAKAAVFSISKDDLKRAGATLQESCDVLQEALMLPYVELAVLLDLDNEYEVLKIKVKEI
jgi:phosphoesterase RecJ-like protein